MHLWLTMGLVSREAYVVYSVYDEVTALRGFIKMKIQRIKHTEWRTAILN